MKPNSRGDLRKNFFSCRVVDCGTVCNQVCRKRRMWGILRRNMTILWLITLTQCRDVDEISNQKMSILLPRAHYCNNFNYIVLYQHRYLNAWKVGPCWTTHPASMWKFFTRGGTLRWKVLAPATKYIPARECIGPLSSVTVTPGEYDLFYEWEIQRSLAFQNRPRHFSPR